ncbi:MAG: AIR synthase-related protein, partial [Candidatus Puniceispirillaceae bacterium]
GESLYAAHHGVTAIYAPPPVDLDAEKRTGDLLRRLIAEKLVTAAHDISDGGLGVAVAEMSLHTSFGAHITLPASGNMHGWAFGEDQARYVVTTPDAESLIAAAKSAAIPIARIGTVTAQAELQFGDHDTISVKTLRSLSEGCLPALMAG